MKTVGVIVALEDTESIDDIVPPLSFPVCEGERVS
jgi:hypothetical protein